MSPLLTKLLRNVDISIDERDEIVMISQKSRGHIKAEVEETEPEWLNMTFSPGDVLPLDIFSGAENSLMTIEVSSGCVDLLTPSDAGGDRFVNLLRLHAVDDGEELQLRTAFDLKENAAYSIPQRNAQPGDVLSGSYARQDSKSSLAYRTADSTRPTDSTGWSREGNKWVWRSGGRCRLRAGAHGATVSVSFCRSSVPHSMGHTPLSEDPETRRAVSSALKLLQVPERGTNVTDISARVISVRAGESIDSARMKGLELRDDRFCGPSNPLADVLFYD
jgi:hypothetical protein